MTPSPICNTSQHFKRGELIFVFGDRDPLATNASYVDDPYLKSLLPQ